MTGRGVRGRPRGSTNQAILQQQQYAQAQMMAQQQQAAAAAAAQQHHNPKHQQQHQQYQQQQQQQQQIQASAGQGAQIQPGDQPTAHKKPTNRNLSALFDDILPESILYRQLQETERKIDATLHRKKLDLQDVLATSQRQKQTMRIFISNSVVDQPWQVMNRMEGSGALDFESLNTSSSWTLRIEGRLLGDKEPLDSPKRAKFSSYFTSIIVEFEGLEDPNQLPVAEWHEVTDKQEKQRLISKNQNNKLEFDALDIHRKGSRPVKAKVMLQVKELPNKMRLSPQLAELLAIDEATKPAIVQAMWQYIKFYKLQDPEDRRMITCDAGLKKVFNCDSFTFPQVIALIDPHLKPRLPVVLEYEIQIDKENNVGENVYDIEIELDHPKKLEMTQMLEKWNDQVPEIQALDDQIALTIQAMNETRLKHQFMKSMAEEPVQTVQHWLDSQASDLKLITSDKGFNEEEVRRSEFYTDEVLNQTIHLFLNAKR